MRLEWGRTALILAAGQQTRWPGVTAKHLADIAGEPAIVRLIRQARDRRWEPVVVTRHGYLPDNLGCRIVRIEATPSLCHTIMAVPPEILRSVGLILLGDTVLSKATADECMRRARGTTFVRVGYENLSLRIEDPELLVWAATKAIERLPRQDLRLRDLMSVLGGFREPGYRETYALDVEITDWSIDIDDESRYQSILSVIGRGLVDDLPVPVKTRSN